MRSFGGSIEVTNTFCPSRFVFADLSSASLVPRLLFHFCFCSESVRSVFLKSMPGRSPFKCKRHHQADSTPPSAESLNWRNSSKRKFHLRIDRQSYRKLD